MKSAGLILAVLAVSVSAIAGQRENVIVREVVTPAASLYDFVPIVNPVPMPTPYPAPTPVPAPGATPGPLPSATPLPPLPTPLPGSIQAAQVDAWVVLGQKAWTIVTANKPNATVQQQRLAVLPAANLDWMQLANWQGPASKTFKVDFPSAGASVTYTIVFNYGGSFQGQGAFITNLNVIPTALSVGYGKQLTIEVIAGNPINYGAENPIAGIELQMKWKLDTPFSHQEGVHAYAVKGNGEIVRIN